MALRVSSLYSSERMVRPNERTAVMCKVCVEVPTLEDWLALGDDDIEWACDAFYARMNADIEAADLDDEFGIDDDLDDDITESILIEWQMMDEETIWY